MKRTSALLLLLILFYFHLSCEKAEAQELSDSAYVERLTMAFGKITSYSQEKVYLHTDKPCYFAGDTIWLKAYLVDAVSHLPSLKSHFVYAELINRKSKVMQRIKIKKEEGRFLGYIALDEQTEEGEYSLRAYTRWMLNEEPEFFFSKHIKVYASKAALVSMSVRYEEEGTKRKAIVTCKKPDGSPCSGLYAHYMVRTKPHGNSFRQQQLNRQGEMTVSLPEKEKEVEQYLYVVVENGPLRHKRTFYVPNRFDFTADFFPEGGSLIAGAMQKVGVKCIDTDGMSVDFTGAVLDGAGDTVVHFRSAYAGMGSFMLPVLQGESYRAVIRSTKGLEKTFPLPETEAGRIALSVAEQRGILRYTILHEPDTPLPSPLYLVGHVRGNVMFVKPITSEQGAIGLTQVPDGILTLILLDKEFLPHSERLFFVRHEDAQWQMEQPKEPFTARSEICLQLHVTDASGQPLRGDFSLSVTDDYAVSRDSLGDHILSNLLLTSDLKGHIETPGYYFHDHSARVRSCLDNLMLTQGWSRFDRAKLLEERRQFTHPIEQGQYISGRVVNIKGKPLANKVVSVSVGKKLYPATVTGADGTFAIEGLDFSPSVQVTAKVIEQDKLLRSELRLDRDDFPVPFDKHPYAFERYLPRNNYVERIQSPYVEKNGMLMLNLPEVTISARSLVKDRFSSYKMDDEEEISQRNARTALDLVKEVPGFQIIDNRPYVNPNYSQRPAMRMSTDTNNRDMLKPTGKANYGMTATFMLDSRPVNFRDLPLIPADEIVAVHKIDPEVNSAIDIGKNLRLLETTIEEALDNGATIEELEELDVTGRMKSAVDGVQVTAGGCILLTSRSGNMEPPHSNSQGDAVILTGYTRYKRFYEPKYTPSSTAALAESDERTTLHWQPVLTPDENGTATIRFFSSDRSFSSYTVTVEGMTEEGIPLRHVETLR